MEEQTIFDLIEIYFGDEKTAARPFEFSQDDDGNLIKALKASTSCPYCGHGQTVDLNGWIGGAIGVKCENCGAGDSYFVEQPERSDANFTTVGIDRSEIQSAIESELSEDNNESIVVEPNNSITIDDSNDVQTLKSGCAFVDPIELGLMTIESI